MYNLWILVASRGQAKLYQRSRVNRPFKLLQEFVQPEAQLKAREINTDRQGRRAGPAGSNQNGKAVFADPTVQLALEFVQKIKPVLENGRSQGEYEGLILVAGPKMLGYLRARSLI